MGGLPVPPHGRRVGGGGADGGAAAGARRGAGAAGRADVTGGKLCDLGDGDMITIQWSGELRLVAVQGTADGGALRDLSDPEGQAVEGEYGGTGLLGGAEVTAALGTKPTGGARRLASAAR